MARTHRPRVLADPSGTARHARSLAKKTKAPYKVVFEQVSEKKKKLITVLSFNSRAPPGYSFIPAGDPSITNRCKELAREDRLKVYIVSTSRHKHQANLSHEVHRIGYHFPSSVVEKACMSLGVSLTQSGLVIPVQGGRPGLRSNRSHPNRKTNNNRAGNVSSTANVSQATLDIQAQQAIKDLFPKIPAKDVRAIVGRAFQKGKSRVGTAVELPISRRVQLAVVAHIRHVYTDYDNLLRTGTYYEARAAIEKPCLDLLAQWRSDDDDDPNAMEEILREVIVIDDDDEEDSDRRSPLANQQYSTRDDSVEIISSHAFADEVQMRPIDYSESARSADRDRLHSPEHDSRAIVQYAGLRQYRQEQYQQNDPIRFDPGGIHQLRWREALHRRKNSASALVNDDPTVQDITNHRGLFFQEVFEPQPHRLEAIQQQLRPIEARRSVPSQDPLYTDVMPAQPQEKPEIPIRFFTNRGNNGLSPKLKQIVLPEEQYPRNKPLEHIEFVQRGEAGHDSSEYGIDQQRRIVHLGEKRRTTMDQYHGQNPLDDFHQQGRYPPRRQSERVLPSIEDNLQGGRHFQDVFDVAGEHSSKLPHTSAGFSHEQNHRHQVAKLSNKIEASTGENFLHDELVLLPSDRARQFPREYRQERGIFVPLNSHDERPDSSQRHDRPMYISHMNTFPREERTLHLHPVNAAQKPEMNGATQMPRDRVYYTDHQNQMMHHGQARYIYHEPSEIPTKSADLMQQHQRDSRHANNLAEISPQFPNFHSVRDTLPISHVPLQLQESHSDVDFNRTNNATHSASNQSDMTRFYQFDDGFRPNVKDPITSTAYHQHNFRQVRRDENDRPTYLTSDDPARVGVQERSRTGVFLRKLKHDQEIVSENTRPRTENQRGRYELARLPTQQPTQHFENTTSRHSDLKNTQGRLSSAKTYTGKPVQLLPGSIDDTRYGYDTEQPRYAYVEDELSLARSAERVDRIEVRHGSEYVDRPSWNSRMRPEIIEID